MRVHTYILVTDTPEFYDSIYIALQVTRLGVQERLQKAVSRFGTLFLMALCAAQ